MKRKGLWCGVIAGAVLIGVLVWCCFGRVRLCDVAEAVIVCGDQRTVLSRADCEWVAELLDGQRYAERRLACGISDTCLVLVRENGTAASFYATFDDCPYVWHAERERYIPLSQEKCDAFRALLNTAT